MLTVIFACVFVCAFIDDPERDVPNEKRWLILFVCGSIAGFAFASLIEISGMVMGVSVIVGVLLAITGVLGVIGRGL